MVVVILFAVCVGYTISLSTTKFLFIYIYNNICCFRCNNVYYHRKQSASRINP